MKDNQHWKIFQIISIDPVEGILRKDSGLEELEALKKKISKNEEINANNVSESIILNYGKAITHFFYSLPEKIFLKDDQIRLAKLLSQFESPKELQKVMITLCLAFNRIDALRRKYILFSLNFYYAISKDKEVNMMTISLFLWLSFWIQFH